ncbi:hypothetical protein OG21DRAFT_1479657 [Imleria badia]|nr:hypothetical protein OG21DRAFT_1479657 [Imleria badia]
MEPILETVNKLLEQAKKYKSFTSTFYLNSLKQFINLNTKYHTNPKIKRPMQKVSHAIATSIGKGPYMAHKIRALYRYVSQFRTLPPTNKGNHHAHLTLLDNERITLAMRRYLTVLANSKLGYELKEVKKGIYVNGHEREDVVAYQKSFLTQFGDNERYLTIKPNLGPGERLHVPIMHNKSIIHANDLQHCVYIHDGKMPLRKKGQGCAIHISDFIVEHIGRLTLSPTQVEENARRPAVERLEVTDVCKIIYPGKNHDGFWTNENLIAQVKCTIPTFEQMYPNAVAKFVFDQSSAHGAFVKDALNAKEMNVRPGGKQRKMHDTVIPMDNPNPLLRGMPQTMVFPVDLSSEHPDHTFCGQPKGMQCVLEERGLLSVLEWANNGKVVGECQMCKLSREAQEHLAREVAAAAKGTDDVTADTAGNGFLPKFHCELNPIEMYWGWVSRLVADGTFPTVKCLIPKILNDCPVKTIWAFFRKSWWYMDAYRKGLNAKQAEFATKKYRSHRRGGPAVMMSVKVLLN